MFVTLLVTACDVGTQPVPVPAPPRTIILISLDTLRADYLGLYGYGTHATSPTLDAFADESVVFEASMVTEPWTLTSHMSLMTGLYPQHHGVGEQTKLPEGIDTMAGLLRAQGYATRGHADGGYMRARWGIGRGFDRYEGRRRRGAHSVFREPRDWIREHPNDRFFMFLQAYDVHNYGPGPRYVGKAPYRGRFSAGLRTSSAERITKLIAPQRLATASDIAYVRATYAECVRQVDAELSDLFEFLKRIGLWAGALILVWSDHGEGLFDHGTWPHDQIYEHTVRSVLMMKVPGVEGGRRIRSVVREVDLLPTILELAGAPPVEGIDGRSFAEWIRGERVGGHIAFSKLTRSGKRLFSVRTDTHRYIWDGRTDQSFLFDHRVDPNEKENLSPSGGSLEADLRAQLFTWVDEYDAAVAVRAESRAELPLDAETRDALGALGYLE